MELLVFMDFWLFVDSIASNLQDHQRCQSIYSSKDLDLTFENSPRLANEIPQACPVDCRNFHPLRKNRNPKRAGVLQNHFPNKKEEL